MTTGGNQEKSLPDGKQAGRQAALTKAAPVSCDKENEEKRMDFVQAVHGFVFCYSSDSYS